DGRRGAAGHRSDGRGEENEVDRLAVEALGERQEAGEPRAQPVVVEVAVELGDRAGELLALLRGGVEDAVERAEPGAGQLDRGPHLTGVGESRLAAQDLR